MYAKVTKSVKLVKSYVHTGSSTHGDCIHKIGTSRFYRLYIQPPA